VIIITTMVVEIKFRELGLLMEMDNEDGFLRWIGGEDSLCST